MAYNKINWEAGKVSKEGYVLIDGVKYQTVQPEYEGNTPINPDNLNHMDDEIYNLSNKSAITITLSGTYSYSGNAETKIPLNNVKSIKGSGLTMANDGGVKIGEGIDYVLVSGQVYYFTGSNHNSGKDAIIKKDDTTEVSSNSLVNSNYLKVLTGSKIIDVSQYDTIYLYAKNGSTGACQIGEGVNNTYLTVVEI